MKWILILSVLLCPVVAGAATATLTWTASVPDATHGAATGYNVYHGTGAAVCTASGVLAGPPIATLGNVVLFTDTSPGANGATVCYEVTGTNAGGEGAHSNRATGVIPTNPPSAPTGLTITGMTP